MLPAAQKPLSMVVYTTKFGRHFDAIIALLTSMMVIKKNC